MLLLRGYYAADNTISGRFIVESMREKGRKIVLKKYYFWERYGLEMYIPMISEDIFEKIKRFLKEEQIEFDVWREWRKEYAGEVVGIDIRDDIEGGLILLEYAINIVLREENENRKLKVYFREISPFRKGYICDLEDYENDEEKRKELEKPVEILGWVVYVLNAQD
jgi:hypothetical protein